MGCKGSGSDASASYEVRVDPPKRRVATGVAAVIGVGVVATSDDARVPYGATPGLPTLTVEHVTCSPDCVATTDDYGWQVTVWAATGGQKTVEIAVAISDGMRATKTTSVEFGVPTRIDARRGGTSPSGSVFGMVPNGQQWWDVSVADADGPLLTDLCQPKVSGALATEVDDTRCNGIIGVRALSPGSGTVTMRYGTLVRTETVTVIDPAKIRKVALREVILASDGDVAIESIDGLLAPVRSPIVITDCRDRTLSVVPELTTEDGTIAYGAPDFLGAVPADVHLERYGQTVDVSFGHARSGTLRGNFGIGPDAVLSVPFVSHRSRAADRDTLRSAP